MSRYDLLVQNLLEASKTKIPKDKKSRDYLAHRDEIIAAQERKAGKFDKAASFEKAAAKLKGKTDKSKK